MNNLQFTPFSLPEWYTAERDTAKAIGRLDSVKELNYYINNPDDAVRRLAILRLSVLKPKDIELALRGVLDNPLESEANKELAAWAIKSSALKWNKDVLLSSRYLSRFTGEEKFDELFGVSYSNQDRWIGPSFDASILFRGLPAEAGDVYAMHSLDIDADFNTSEWLRAAASNILSGLKPLLLGIARLPFKLFIQLPANLIKSAKEASAKKAEIKAAEKAEALARAQAEAGERMLAEAAAKAEAEERLIAAAAAKADAEERLKSVAAANAGSEDRSISESVPRPYSSPAAIRQSVEPIPAFAGISSPAGRISRSQARSMMIGVEESYSDTVAEKVGGNHVIGGRVSPGKENNRSSSRSRGNDDMYRSLYRKPGIGSALKNSIMNLLYVLFFPIRLLNRHKVAVLVSIVAIYAFINVTPFGKNLTVYYLGDTFWTAQNSFAATVESKAVSLFTGFRTAASGDNAIDGKSPSKASSVVNSKAIDISGRAIYEVTASKGLNLRSAADSTSEKVTASPLEFGSKVYYLDKSQTDAKGKLWYYIMTSEGLKGWASASYLKEEGAGK